MLQLTHFHQCLPMHHDGAGRRAARHAHALPVFEGADGGGGEAAGDVASHQLGGFGGAAVHDEGGESVVFP
ncbi:hypothetical protein JHN59_11275 [Streptomyces sp. MBT49]|uniref:hypothetical protein n=1 Tax=Streptomyces sp. MBT49 TaxID=1488380 RepID=UPI0019094809|nr:hypothetical protein [Streptomyces sp. MBT49]MBK3625418.1 hypothetical protein [Streptomyces sp. MBT49]